MRVSIKHCYTVEFSLSRACPGVVPGVKPRALRANLCKVGGGFFSFHCNSNASLVICTQLAAGGSRAPDVQEGRGQGRAELSAGVLSPGTLSPFP